MAEERARRKLSAIVSADVKGYSRLMGEDEIATIETLKKYREVMAALIEKFQGRVVDSPGDNVLAEFASVIDAVDCAVMIQKELKQRNEEFPERRRMEFRIGVNLGDVVEDGERIYGDGVNIAARIESLSEGGGICVSGTAFDQIGRKLPLGFEYLGEQTVKNIEKPVRVYRVLTEPQAAGRVFGGGRPRLRSWLWAAVSALIVVCGALAVWNFYLRQRPVEPASAERMAFPLPEKPSIAVLPFVNMTGDPNLEYISDGMTENMITALSRVPELFVIARNSVFTYKGKAIKIGQVSEELGVQYVLEGSIQQSESRLRITAQLIDATRGHHLWAERFDRDLKDLFALQDEVTLNILAALRVKFTHGEQARVQETTKSLEAWSYLVKGLSHFESFTREGNARAQELFEQAVQADPTYSYALAMLGWTHWMDAAFGYSRSGGGSFKKAVEIAGKTAALDDKLPDVHALLGGIYLFQRQYDKAIAEGQRAVALGPNIACNKAILARTMLFAGRFEEAITLVRSAMRLNPHYPSWYLESLAMGYAVIGEHEKAVASYRELLNLRRNARGNMITPLLGLAANCMLLGREEEARAHAREILEVNPDFSLERFLKVYIFKDPSHLRPFVEALHRAGLPEHPRLPLPDKPSIAVLPFLNMSGDPEQEYFSDGITEEIITALSKTPKLFVIARNSTFTYKGKPVKAKQVGRELGVRYVLEGSVRKAGDKVRVTAQLIDATTEKHLWAERYDRELKDIFAIQDEITLEIIKAMQVELTMGETARVTGKGTKNLDAYLRALHAQEQWLRMDKEGGIKARQLATEAIALDPGYGYPYAIVAWCHMLDVVQHYTQSPKESMRLAVEAIQKALVLDSSDHRIHRILSNLYVLQGKHDDAIAASKRALELCPGCAGACENLGIALLFACRPGEALPMLEKAIELDPFPPAVCHRNLAMAYRHLGRYEDAIVEGKKAFQMNPNDLFAPLGLALAYAKLGRKEEARGAAAAVLRINPYFSLDSWAETQARMFAVKCRSDRVYEDIEFIRKADVGLK